MSFKCPHARGVSLSLSLSGSVVRRVGLPLVLLAAAGALGTGCSSGDQGGGGPATCGNNQLDPGEMCDGPNFLPTTTCGSLTFNQRPSGVPLCTSACQIDVSTCSAGVPGGATGAGGALGAGGYQTGAGGILIGTAGTATGGVGIGGTNVGGNGTGGSVGTGGSNVGGSAGQPMMAPPGEPQIPPAPASCPQLRTGNITVLGQQVQLFVGTKQADKKGAVLFYWHGTGSNSGEASVIMGTQINEITSEGGIVASFTTSTGTGSTTGNLVWYTDDFNMADQILACAIQQLNID